MFIVPIKTVRLDVIGESTGEKFEGDFTFKLVLSMQEKHEHQLMYARLLGDVSMPTDTLQFLAMVKANMRFYIYDSPLWWKESDNSNNLYDMNILLELNTMLSQAIKENNESRKAKALEKN